MRGLYWLILGLCIWFIPTIMFEIVVTSGTEISPEEAVSDIQKELVVILFAAALPIILKGVINIRKERKTNNKNSMKDKKKSRKK